MLYGAIEAGGTKFICAVGQSHDQLLREARVPTTTPEETLARVVEFFHDSQAKYGKLDAMGVASFGPLGLIPDRPEYGHILSTPKAGWSHTNLIKVFESEFQCPMALDTDVNAAALAEYELGAGRALQSLAYVTVGTGIGGGLIRGGQLYQGRNHPELGHMLIPQPITAPPFEGSCPYHGHCAEGLASGAALLARWGQPAETLPDNHIAWTLEADHLACVCINLTVSFAPEKIILGGSVMHQQGLLQRVRDAFTEKFANYQCVGPLAGDSCGDYIARPELGDWSGIVGAFIMASSL